MAQNEQLILKAITHTCLSFPFLFTFSCRKEYFLIWKLLQFVRKNVFNDNTLS